MSNSITYIKSTTYNFLILKIILPMDNSLELAKKEDKNPFNL